MNKLHPPQKKGEIEHLMNFNFWTLLSRIGAIFFEPGPVLFLKVDGLVTQINCQNLFLKSCKWGHGQGQD